MIEYVGVFKTLLSIYDWFKSLFKERKANESNTFETIADRFVRLFENHGVHRNQIPRFFGHGLTIEVVQSNKNLLKALTNEILEDVCKLFGVRLEWLEGADQQVYKTHDFYKCPRDFLKFIKDVNGKGLQGCVDGVLLIPDSKKNHSQALMIIQKTIGYIGDKPVYKMYLSNNWYYAYWKARAYLASCIAIAWKHSLDIQGRVIPSEEIDLLLYGNELLGFEGEGIYAFMGGPLFHPEDLALVPSTFLKGVDPEIDNFGHISGLKLWLDLDSQDLMDTGLRDSSARLDFENKLKELL